MAILNTANLTSKIPTPDGGKVSVTTISNTQRTNNISTDLEIVMSAERTWAIPAELEFIADSVKVDDVQKLDANPNDGFSLPDLNAGGQIKVEFMARVK